MARYLAGQAHPSAGSAGPWTRGQIAMMLPLVLVHERERRLGEASPESGIIAVLDREIPQLAGLAWDLGAQMVFFAPIATTALVETVSALLRSLHGQVETSIPLAEPDVERHP